ncbi:MAG: hypothetical protein Fur002_21050 [Anaerolineales bacterium]
MVSKEERREIYKIVVVYLVVGFLWIFLSDQAAAQLAKDHSLFVRLNTYKGWAFVSATGALLFWLIHIYTKKITEDTERLRRSIAKRETMQEQLNLLAQTVEQSPASIVVTDVDGNIEYVNETFCKITGYRAHEVLGKNPRILKSGYTTPEEYKILWDTITSGQKWSGEFLDKKKNGELYWESARISPIFNGEGVITHFLAVKENITERKVAEQKLQEAYATLEWRVKERTAELQDLYDNAPNGYHSLDEEGRFTHINQTALNWLGYAREELIGKRLVEILTPDDARRFTEEEYPLFMRQGWIKDFEYDLVRKDGSLLPVLLSATAVYDEQGRYKMSRAIITDNTERKRAAQALQESERRFHTMFQKHSAAMLLIDPISGEILDANASAASFYGYSIERLKQMQIQDINMLPQQEVAKLREPAAKESLNSFIMPHKLANGQRRIVEVYSSPIAIQGKTILFSIIHDTTERQLAKEELQRSRDELSAANLALKKAARMKDDFLASMSHELRTPLTGVLGLAEALQAKTYGEVNEKQLRILKMIEDSGRHLLELINDILDLSKVEAGKMEIKLADCSADDLCRASLQLTKGMAHKKNQIVHYEPPAQPVYFQADAQRVKQILVNLLSNAVKFTPEGGEIGLEVEASEAEGKIRFSVWDKGIGVKAEDMSKLFQPFVQIDSRLAREYAGTGLGLSLVRRLTELHRGGIEVNSAFGEGSRFTVTLPYAPPQAAPPSGETSPVQASAAQPIRRAAPAPLVMIADDNETTLSVLADYLEARGYRVIKTRSGMELLERAEQDPPAALLIDVQMPGMDGMEAIRRARAHPNPQIARAPIAAVTALAMPGDRERCMEAGANEYVSKPFRLTEIEKMIAEFIAPKE